MMRPLGGRAAFGWYALAAGILALDQATKAIATAFLDYGESVAALPFLAWTFACNTGVAFSLFEGFSSAFAVVAAVVGAYLAFEIWRWKGAGTRGLVEGAAYVRAGRWQTWGPSLLLGQDVAHATLGVLGFGRIGKGMARRGAGFDMRVLFHDDYIADDDPAIAALGAEKVGFERLLAEADFVSIHTPLTPETHHLMNAEAFARMKPTGIVINTARGPLIDPEALHTALTTGQIGYAALDVTDPEPIPPDSPLLGLNNLIIAPHIASASVATRSKMAEMAAQNLIAGLEGRRLPHCANPEVYR